MHANPFARAWYRAFAGGVTPTLPSDIAAANSRLLWRAWLKAAGAVAIALVAVVASSFLALLGLRSFPALLSPAALCGLPFALIAIPVRAARARRENVRRARHAARAARTFGVPGSVRNAAHLFGQEAAEAGARGEEATAAMLDLLLDIPGTMVFHGLQFPGNSDADVDHAVSHGNVVFLLDSKLYRWGTYEWMPGPRDRIGRNDRYGPPRPNWMHVAAAGYRRLPGPDVEVIALVMIHGRNTSVGAMSLSPNGVHMATAGDVMERIGNTFASGLTFLQESRRMCELLKGKVKAV